MASVLSLSKSNTHTFSKDTCFTISLIAGQGVVGDAHMGAKVKHRSRVAKDPNQPNLRQVHLIHSELFEELSHKGFTISPGQIGENITTRGIDLLGLPRDTLLKIGDSVIIRVTGLRNPCAQLDKMQEGLMKAVLDRDNQGNLIRKAGIMAVVLQGGDISIGDKIIVELPVMPHQKLERV